MLPRHPAHREVTNLERQVTRLRDLVAVNSKENEDLTARFQRELQQINTVRSDIERRQQLLDWDHQSPPAGGLTQLAACSETPFPLTAPIWVGLC